MSLTAQQLMIRASAGTGKTFQLTNRYLRQLVEGTPPDEILATTFTRKAAGEILERVMKRLADAALSKEKAVALADEIDKPCLQPVDFQQVLHGLTHELHRLQVCTLDSFFSRVATSYTLELGLPPGWTIIDEQQDELLRQEALAAIIREETTADIRRLTNLLEKGDAGRNVTNLVRDTINNFYEVYEQSDALAWKKLPQLKRMTDAEFEQAIRTLEQVDLPKHKSIEKARLKDLDTLMNEDWESFVDGGIAGAVMNGSLKYYGKVLSPFAVQLYQQLIDNARAVLIGELDQQTRATYELLERFAGVYRQLKHEKRAVCFNDVPRELQETFARQGMPHVAYRLDRDVSHLLLDEFQDTAPVQWDVLSPFAVRIAKADQRTSFFCVGDIKQAIYGWRGGVAELFDELKDQFPQLIVLPLNQSFRSSPPVIELVNRIFTGMTQHPNLDKYDACIRDWCDAFETHTTAKQDLPGYACVVGGSAPASEEEKPKDAALRSTAERVAAISRNTPWASVGVLLRTHDEITDVMNELRRLGIEASEEGGNYVTDAASVQAMMSLLQMADHPGDTVARFHVSQSPLAEKWVFVDHMNDEHASAVSAEVRRSLVEEGYGPSLRRWARLLLPSCSERERLRLGQLLELADQYDAQPSLRPRDFVDSLKAEKFVDPSPARVQVMTFHKSKGLQFDVVVVPLVENDLKGRSPKFFVGRSKPTAPIESICLYRNEQIHAMLPPEMQQALQCRTDNVVRETLCRLYVALTRAVHALHVIVPVSGEKESKLPKNPAGLVRAGLNLMNRVLPNQPLEELGDPQWFKGLDDPSRSAPSDETDSSTQVCVNLAPMPEGRTRGLSRVAPSRHDAAPHRVSLIDVVGSEDDRALTLGSLIHVWFEQIEWLENGMPDDEMLRHVARQRGFGEVLIREAMQSFGKMLGTEEIHELLSRGRYADSKGMPWCRGDQPSPAERVLTPEVRREQSIAVAQQGELMTGNIDRLVLLRDGDSLVAAEVIDFKTDLIDAQNEVELRMRVEYYRGQLNAYATAVARTYGLTQDCISLQLVFVSRGTIVDVSQR
ncbi:MAG: UvrD-helicase domain-containing protein [Planctomycetaceae bacterium]|nr:UvrD-helicase domain-containing protein [Planctomycetaceae bacterium]